MANEAKLAGEEVKLGAITAVFDGQHVGNLLSYANDYRFDVANPDSEDKNDRLKNNVGVLQVSVCGFPIVVYVTIDDVLPREAGCRADGTEQHTLWVDYGTGYWQRRSRVLATRGASGGGAAPPSGASGPAVESRTVDTSLDSGRPAAAAASSEPTRAHVAPPGANPRPDDAPAAQSSSSPAPAALSSSSPPAAASQLVAASVPEQVDVQGALAQVAACAQQLSSLSRALATEQEARDARSQQLAQSALAAALAERLAGEQRRSAELEQRVAALDRELGAEREERKRLVGDLEREVSAARGAQQQEVTDLTRQLGAERSLRAGAETQLALKDRALAEESQRRIDAEKRAAGDTSARVSAEKRLEIASKQLRTIRGCFPP